MTRKHRMKEAGVQESLKPLVGGIGVKGGDVVSGGRGLWDNVSRTTNQGLVASDREENSNSEVNNGGDRGLGICQLSTLEPVKRSNGGRGRGRGYTE